MFVFVYFVLQNLVERLNSILTGVYSVSLKNLALRLLLVLATVSSQESGKYLEKLIFFTNINVLVKTIL